ncbi:MULTISPECIES: hypothetical protein [Moorena]|nr:MULTISPECIES: hypothetical protein [Moorena]NEP37366.1 hypothetical protein [Moorena sp. SIO3B2]NEP67636.1 hypothetical protein [Moorena sp. SIO3A5]NER86966.1 hypothetical protein [Moorena sp. SIO3A2]NET67388.1 hypothetical protein [Moorena sp. SIO1G6]
MANRNPPLTPTRRGRAGDGSVIGGNSGRFSDIFSEIYSQCQYVLALLGKKPTQVREGGEGGKSREMVRWSDGQMGEIFIKGNYADMILLGF